jgi:hypothetical protein
LTALRRGIVGAVEAEKMETADFGAASRLKDKAPTTEPAVAEEILETGECIPFGWTKFGCAFKAHLRKCKLAAQGQLSAQTAIL